MKVIIYSTHTLWPYHAETELEIMQKHLEQGDTIYRFVCNGELPVCDTNAQHKMYSCLKCVDKQKMGQQLLSGHERIISRPLYSSESLLKAKQYPFEYKDLSSFKEEKIEGFDIGYAVSSSVISELRDPVPDIQKNLHLFKGYFYSSLAIYFNAKDAICELQPDLIYAFNGRVAHAKPVLRAAQEMKVECRIHERGCDIYHYGITVNTTPHDIGNFQRQMNRYWDNADAAEREKIGRAFYEERVKGKEQAWVSFVKEQKSDLLPQGWNTSVHNIAFFNTSEDEYESIGPEWKNELYPSQAIGIAKILTAFQGDENYHFYLRIHPNLRGLKNKQIEDAYALSRFTNLTIIDADSQVSTYTLMMNCEKVITFGSSTGIEAAYWDKVSILLGKSFYFGLDVAYEPQTHEEVVSMIRSELKPKNKTGALKYGYYWKTFGEKFTYFKATGFMTGTFKGVDVEALQSFKTKFFLKLNSFSLLQKIYHATRSSAVKIQKLLVKW
ncbi:MAG: hypothetical protein U0X76_07715 [Bacteroidia bacterium]